MTQNKKYLDLLRWALINIVKSILFKISNYGLEGKQNFIIRFYNHFDPNYFFDDQFTTITLQNNHQNLTCNDNSFSLNIKLNGFNKRITIPFDAVALLLDPSARFGLELGQCFDEYKLTAPQEESNTYDNNKIIKHQNNIIEFNENIIINKYNVSNVKNTQYQIDYIEITRFYFFNTIKLLLEDILKSKDNHNLCIEIKKDYPGVILPPNLNIPKNQSTVVISLKEKFFNLNIYDDYFSVILSFNKKLHQIQVPYKSIAMVFDPHWDFKIDLTFIDFLEDQILEHNDKLIYVNF